MINELDCNILCDFTSIPKDEWQELRKNNYYLGHITLGGSDAGVVMGVNKYKDMPQLFLEKQGLVDIPVESEAVEWGNILEPVIANKFMTMNKHLMVKEYPYLLQNSSYPFAVANIDRLLYDVELGEYGVLEIKTASEYVKGDWENGNIPASYYAQVQHYFMVTGLKWGYFAVLIGGNKYHQVQVLRNDDYINNLLFQEEMFMTRVQMNQMPEMTGSESSDTLLKHLYPEAQDGEVILDESDGELLERREHLKAEIEELKTELAECENKIKAKIGEKSTGVYNCGLFQYKVTWNNSKGRTTLNSKKLKDEMPDVFQKYSEQGKTFRTFKVTRKVVS